MDAEFLLRFAHGGLRGRLARLRASARHFLIQATVAVAHQENALRVVPYHDRRAQGRSGSTLT